MIRPFEEYVRDGIVAERSADPVRARSLRADALRSYEVLKSIETSIGLTRENANTLVKLAYDVVMSAIRSHMTARGLHAAGRGAHEAEVAYVRSLGMGERDVSFCDQLRYVRNGIMYYGKDFDPEYAASSISFASRMLERLDVGG